MTDNTAPHMARLWRNRTPSDLMASWLHAIAAVPRLDGGICRGSSDWDLDHDCDGEPSEAREDRLSAAVAACRRCPALTACTEWIDGLSPHQRPTGVVAAQVIDKPARKRTTTPRRTSA